MQQRNNRSPQELSNQWEQACERALHDAPHADDLIPESLNEAAGLNVKSGVQGGGWGNSSAGGVVTLCSTCATTCSC